MHHNIDAYRKSLFLVTLDKFQNRLSKCFQNRFRRPDDIQRILFNLDMVYSGNAELKIVSDPKPWRLRLDFLKKVKWESYYGADNDPKIYTRIVKYKPKLFCINSGADARLEEKMKVKQFMESLFPQPSKFEKI